MLHAVIPERKGVEAKMFLFHLQVFCCNHWGNFCRYC